MALVSVLILTNIGLQLVNPQIMQYFIDEAVAGSPETMKTDKKHGSRQESQPLSDRPEIEWLCRT